MLTSLLSNRFPRFPRAKSPRNETFTFIYIYIFFILDSDPLKKASRMDAPISLLLVSSFDFARVDVFVSGWNGGGMDVATLRVYGLYGFGFFVDNEVNVVVQFLLDNLIDFRIYTDDTPCVAIHPPPAPTSWG